MVNAVVPEAQLALSQQPQTQIDASVFNRPLSVAIGGGLEQLGSGLEADADTQAKAQAASDLQKGVTLDADGKPVVGTSANSFILGQAGQDYHEAMVAGLKSGLQSKVTNDLLDIRQQFPTDPVGYQQAAAAYVNKTRQTPGLDPAASDALANQAATEASQHHANLVEASMSRDTSSALQTIQAQIGDAKDKLSALARQGATTTPEYKQLQTQLVDNYHALTGNPLFGYSPARAQSELDSAQSQIEGDHIVGQVDAAFKRTGGDGGKAGAQKLLTDGILNNADLHLDDAQRKQLYSFGLAHLQYLTSENKAQIDANRVTQNDLIDKLKTGVPIDPTVIGQARAQAQSLGDAEGVMKIDAYTQQATRAKAYAGLNDEQRLLAQTGGPRVASGGYIGALRQQENNTGNPLAGNGGGTYQFTPGTWSNVMAQHPELNLTAGGRTDPQQEARAVVAFTNDNKSALSSAGIEPTDANTYMAHFLGANGATSFIKAMQQNPAQPAAPLNLAAATANPTVFYKNGDPTQPRSLSEVYALQTRRFGGGTTPVVAAAPGNGVPSVAQMQANPFVMAAYLDSLGTNKTSEVSTAKAVGDALVTRFEKGDVPPPATVAAFMQQSQKYPELSEISQKVDTQMRGAAAATQAEALPSSQGGAYIQQVETLKKGADLNVQARADAAQSIYEKGQKALATDPPAEAARRGWLVRPPVPLDFSSPQGAAAVPQAMAERARAAAVIGSFTGVSGTSALFPNDLPQVKSIMTSGTLDQRMSALDAITGAGMSEPVLKATLGALAGSKETLPLAVAGSVSRDNPQAARDILQGQQLMQAEPKLAPNKDDFPGEFAKVLPFNDFPQTEVRQGMDGAVQAMYAKMSADAGDTTGVINADRVDKAVTAVTGGVFNYRGAKAVTPWYGATQADSDAAIRTLSDADFATARTSDGSTFPANALKPSFSGAFTWNNWRLQSYGDGKYLVFSGADTARQYLNDAGGGRFVLDLGAKRDQAKRAGMGLVQSVNTPLAESTYYGGGN